jgi:hypothetical protein
MEGVKCRRASSRCPRASASEGPTTHAKSLFNANLPTDTPAATRLVAGAFVCGQQIL